MIKRTFFLLLFASCTLVQPSYGPVAMNHRKHKHKAALLQKKLAAAERKLQETQEETQRIRSALCEAELNAIEIDLEHLEKKWQTNPEQLLATLQQEAPHLFLEERQMLHTIIDLDESSLRAQLLLDRFLQLITQLSETSNRVSPS